MFHDILYIGSFVANSIVQYRHEFVWFYIMFYEIFYFQENVSFILLKI